MHKYHKIQSVFLRDPATKHRTFLEGEFADPAFAYLKDNRWRFTEKIDGTNIRVSWEGTQVHFGGRTDRAQIPVPLIARLREVFDTPAAHERWRLHFGEAATVTLYGEGFGTGIQKVGKHYLPDRVDFILFDVYINGVWLGWDNVEDVARKMEIPVAPVIGEGTLAAAMALVREGFTSRLAAVPAEGLVIRPAVDLHDRHGRRIITKVKTRDFR